MVCRFCGSENEHLRDNTLSMRAKGLLSVMLSLPNNWDYSINGLAAISAEGVTAIKNTLKELQQTGYLVVTKKMPNETTSGRIEYIYDIYENKKQGDRKQGVENLPLENLSVENLSVENQRQLNTKELNTKELNKEKEIKKEGVNKVNINGEGNGENIGGLTSSLDDKKEKEDILAGLDDLAKKAKERKRSGISEEDDVLFDEFVGEIKVRDEDEFTKHVVGYFNRRIGTDYRYQDKLTTRHIRARYRDKYHVKDLLGVIDKKRNEWLGTPFSSNLNLDTLFKRENFEKYRNQIVCEPCEKKDEYAYNFCSE